VRVNGRVIADLVEGEAEFCRSDFIAEVGIRTLPNGFDSGRGKPKCAERISRSGRGKPKCAERISRGGRGKPKCAERISRSGRGKPIRSGYFVKTRWREESLYIQWNRRKLERIVERGAEIEYRHDKFLPLRGGWRSTIEPCECVSVKSFFVSFPLHFFLPGVIYIGAGIPATQRSRSKSIRSKN